MNAPGQRFHEWTKGGLRIRRLDERVVSPNRRGVAEIEHHALVAEAHIDHCGISPELLRYIKGIGEHP